MAWVYLVIAGLFEVVWAIGLKYSEGWSKLVPSAITVVGMGISFYFLSMALKALPIGTAYAIWTGIGALGTVVVGMIAFGEPSNIMRIVFLLCIIAGIVGLKLTAGG
ncbi:MULTISPECIES: quaternary ammonium compound efflux SMR transporter SugE [Brevibacillus]|jgi:quaternary ammonium compound-resistance protein SugE|uniref:Small multidrug resistance protein n=1 Tax=Brevibacillus borstelensis AK1 TaxID=1300222 RepID=M8DY48_9BACL|nr:quaternary ammonium compound efflux SMR transporter SugE [Brevibacillus borstelensis]EMT51951.1 small multidrug resistance protein [Brevibacillus borstelensis AK1]KKX56450.1 membrane protein [Brevibacillus borstelensis cifa_chp40]MBE5398244.1 quaternary ammonium compound efflux SMR transporter SugE [Brevibacillus borstelensis]MCC0564726.1 quaternary ammonium compound efflux SMR transporter SugE [Brevibacillus borstelensis]MCM3468839.1 quaternary ammonium compound efflux SMR transporter SugE